MARVVVVGAGAVGCYYGALLARAGHDVAFVLRRDFEAVRRHGLTVFSPAGDFVLQSPEVVRTAGEAGEADLVICSLKTTAMDVARDLVAPAVGPRTRILALMNGLGIEEQFASWFGRGRVFGGMAFVCINRGRPGTVHHLDYGRVTLAHACDDADALRDLHRLLAESGVDVASAPSLVAARWEKLCWNVPFSGLSVAAGGVGTATILGDAWLRDCAEQAMREVVAAGNADVAARGAEGHLEAEDVVSRMFALTGTMGDYQPSMVIDYVLGRPLEVEAILAEPVRRARAGGVPVPTMLALLALVNHADRRRRGLEAALTPGDLFQAG